MRMWMWMCRIHAELTFTSIRGHYSYVHSTPHSAHHHHTYLMWCKATAVTIHKSLLLLLLLFPAQLSCPLSTVHPTLTPQAEYSSPSQESRRERQELHRENKHTPTSRPTHTHTYIHPHTLVPGCSAAQKARASQPLRL